MKDGERNEPPLSPADQLRGYAARLLGHPTTIDIMAAAAGMEMMADELEKKARAWTDGTGDEPEHHDCPHCGGRMTLLYPAEAVEQAAAVKDRLVDAYNTVGDLLEAHIDATSRLLRLVRPHDPARMSLSPDRDDEAVIVEADPGMFSPQDPG